MRGASQPVFINEIHYDNTGIDVNEGVEIAGPAGTDLSCYLLCLYNQTDSAFYDTVYLYGVIDDEGCGYGAFWFPIAGIQNGPADGIALVNACDCGGLCDSTDVVQFLSYEGELKAKNGPAAGMQSVDIGVFEPSTLATGNSIQLTGSGVNYSDFTWTAPGPSSGDSINSGQSFGGGIVADRLSFIAYPATCTVKNDTFSLTVCGTDVNGNVSNTYSGTITLSKISGSGNINGTLSLAAASCCARFTNITVDSAGIYTIMASDGVNLNDTILLSFADTCGKCFEIASILVEACEPVPGTEGENEMVRFIVGQNNLDINDLYATWPSNAWLGICQDSTTAAITDSINSMITYGGSVSEPVNGILPAGSTVILVTSTNFDWDSHDWKYLNYNLYMIFQCAGNTQGHFKNNEGCPCGNRTLIMTFTGACSDTVTYTVDSLPNGGNNGDGDMVIYDPQGNAFYGNNLCLPPIFPFSLNLFMASQPVSCKSGCNGKASVFHTGGVKPYNYLWNDSVAQTDSLATGLCAGTYTITVTDWLGTTAVESVTITEPDSLTATIASVTNVSCYGDATGSATVIAAGGAIPYSYVWSNGDNDSLAAAIGNGNYTITVTDSAGCTATAIAVITEPPQLIISVDSLKNVACNGDSNGYVSMSVTGGTPFYSYLWNSGNTGLSVSGVSDGTYSVTVTDSNGCTESSSFNITQPQMLSFIGTPVSSTCGNQNGSACLNVVGGTLPVAITWNTVPPSSGTCINNVYAGVYNPAVTDSNGCTFTAPVSINDIAGPTIDSLLGIDVSCYGADDASINALISGGTPPFTYIWQTGGSTVTTGTLSALNLSDGIYSFTIIDGNGCSVIDSIILTSPVPIAINVYSSYATCGNNDGTAWVNVSGGILPYSYQWNDSALQTNDTAINLFAGAYQVVITDSNGCVDTTNTSVSNLGAPSIIIDSVNNVTCFDYSDGAIFISVIGGNPPFTYSWSNLAATQDILNVVAGIYSVNVVDSLGCIAFANATIPSPVLLSLTVTGDTLLCYGQTAVITANVTGGISPYNYQWSDNLPDQQMQSVTPPVTSQYFVYITDSAGCASDSDSIAVYVLPPLTVNAVSSGAGCPADAVVLSAIASGGNGGPYSYFWLNNGSQNPVITVNPVSDSAFTVIVSDGCSVNDTGTVTIFVYPVPQAAFSSDITNGCWPLTIQFNDSSKITSGIISEWLWIFEIGVATILSFQQNPAIYYSQPGNFEVTLEVISDQGCSDTLTVSDYISVFPYPYADFTATPQSAFISAPEIIFSNVSVLAASSSWNFGDGDTALQVNPVHQYTDTGTFTVTLIVTSQDGCTDTVMKMVTIYPEPKPPADSTVNIPTSFSPNSDDINDTWVIRGINNYPDAIIEIFNRWGSKIFTSANGYPEPWDGTYGGKPVAAATYYFIFTFGDDKKPVTGTVTVVR